MWHALQIKILHDAGCSKNCGEGFRFYPLNRLTNYWREFSACVLSCLVLRLAFVNVNRTSRKMKQFMQFASRKQTIRCDHNLMLLYSASDFGLFFFVLLTIYLIRYFFNSYSHLIQSYMGYFAGLIEIFTQIINTNILLYFFHVIWVHPSRSSEQIILNIM